MALTDPMWRSFSAWCLAQAEQHWGAPIRNRLGQGSDGYHEDHVHMDFFFLAGSVENGYHSMCQWGDVREKPGEEKNPRSLGLHVHPAEAARRTPSIKQMMILVQRQN